MLELIKQNNLFPQLLGAQSVKSDAIYRPISFCVVIHVDDVYAAYNTLTGELLELTEDEAAYLKCERVEACDAVKPLIEKWFLVPLDHDDIELSCEARELAKVFQREADPNSYTIFTTTDCNARCFYCYEMGAKRTPMSVQTAEDVAAFILRTHGTERVRFRWFGGEPLYNVAVIDTICTRLRDAGVEYSSKMVSNAYLFDDALVERAKSLWKLRDVQVTLDGTEAVYNRTKAFIYKDGKSAFAVVTDNIERLLNAEINVSIRMNMGEHNKEDLYALAEWIASRYPDKKYLRAYAHLLFEKEIAVASPGPVDTRMQHARELLDFEEFCAGKGLLKGVPLENRVKVNACMMDSPSAVTILPNGRIGKCEHFLEEGYVGDIYSGVTDVERAESYKERGNGKELCAGCSAFPVCIKLKSCPNEGGRICDAAERMIEEETLKRRVEATYRAAKERLAKEAAEKDAAAENAK